VEAAHTMSEDEEVVLSRTVTTWTDDQGAHRRESKITARASEEDLARVMEFHPRRTDRNRARALASVPRWQRWRSALAAWWIGRR
jgi:hypothetical protein